MGGPVGIEAIAATLQEETDTLVDVVEPFLLKMGMVDKKRSNNIMTSLNLPKYGIKMRPAKEAVEDAIKKYAKNKKS